MKYLVLGLCFAISASADPVLLAQFQKTIGIGPGLVLDGKMASAPLSYGFDLTSTFTSPCVGCNDLIAPNMTGSTVFDSSNTPDWSAFVAILTDGVNETLYSGLDFYLNGVLTDGGAAGDTENDLIGSPDLAGDAVSSIHRNILEITNPEGVYTMTTQWQFWGTGTPVVPQNNIPEPTGLWPLTLPLVLIALHRLLGNQGARA